MGDQADSGPGGGFRLSDAHVTMGTMSVLLPSGFARPESPRRVRRLGLASALVTALAAPAVAVGAADATASTNQPAAAPAQARAAAWTPPTYVRSIGARGSAGLYAWGAAYNPVTNEVLAGDYLNYQVRRYSTGGSMLGSFYRAASDRRGQPEGIAVDPRDGSIYVSDHSRENTGYIAKFSSSGQFIREYQLNTRYQAWITVDSDGYLYVSDSHSWNNATNPPLVRKFRLDSSSSDVTQVATYGSYGTGEGQIKWITGVAVDASTGRVWVADTATKRVIVYNQDGSPYLTIGSSVFTGDLRGVAVNARTRTAYVVDANAGQIERFNADTGVSQGNFGSLGAGAGQFGDGARQITIDGSGNVWAADYGNTRLLKFTASGTFVGAYPSPAQNAPQGALALPRDVAVSPINRGIFVVEQNNHRVQRFNPDGSPNKMWGRRSSTPPQGFNYPRGLALQPGNNRIWISNTTSSAVRIVTPTFGMVKDIKNFSEPVDIEFGNGKAYVGDANGGFVRMLDPGTGATVGQLNVRASGVAVDPASGDIFVSSWYDDRIYHYTPSGGQGVPAVIGSKGTGPGQFSNPWDIDIIGGLIYTTDSDRNVVVVYDKSGNFVGEFGSTGSRPGQFNNPSGLTHDGAGKLYVADAGNDRVQVFDTKGFVKADTAGPAVSITAPKSGASVGFPVTITGTVTDNQRVGTVEVAIQDRVSKLWWDGRIATWGSTKQWTLAGVKGGNVKAANWWFPLIGATARGSYSVSVRSYDAAGNRGGSAATIFSTTAGGRTAP
ncbi:hypothetical protein GCM10009811_32550 [Nostocoides veronense]|uniref:NHL repeat containing protein n=2 Tax=Nostocoides veronense TaxID=330836 RepID=A0ABN2M1P0_9MICO